MLNICLRSEEVAIVTDLSSTLAVVFQEVLAIQEYHEANVSGTDRLHWGPDNQTIASCLHEQRSEHVVVEPGDGVGSRVGKGK